MNATTEEGQGHEKIGAKLRELPFDLFRLQAGLQESKAPTCAAGDKKTKKRDRQKGQST
jgi:hypothetical protein